MDKHIDEGGLRIQIVERGPGSGWVCPYCLNHSLGNPRRTKVNIGRYPEFILGPCDSCITKFFNLLGQGRLL